MSAARFVCLFCGAFVLAGAADQGAPMWALLIAACGWLTLALFVDPVPRSEPTREPSEFERFRAEREARIRRALDRHYAA